MVNCLIKVLEINICVSSKGYLIYVFNLENIFAYLSNTVRPREREPYGTALNMFAYWPFQYIHKYKHMYFSHIKLISVCSVLKLNPCTRDNNYFINHLDIIEKFKSWGVGQFV